MRVRQAPSILILQHLFFLIIEGFYIRVLVFSLWVTLLIIYVFLNTYEIISGTNNRNSTEYFKTVHLNLKAIFFLEQYAW